MAAVMLSDEPPLGSTKPKYLIPRTGGSSRTPGLRDHVRIYKSTDIVPKQTLPLGKRRSRIVFHGLVDDRLIKRRVQRQRRRLNH
jgi:hypothetical protein